MLRIHLSANRPLGSSTLQNSLGIPRVSDIHDPSIPPFACGCFDVTVDGNGRRVSTFDSFLPAELANSRSQNLFICASTVVYRLDVQPSEDGLRVVGVYMKGDHDSDETEYYVSARSEVVLCAGAIATPQILMLR